MNRIVKLKDGRVIETDAVKADRLVRKHRAVYYDTATRPIRESAVRRAVEQR